MTEQLNSRFCKDIGLNIRVLEEPYFSHFLDVFDAQTGCKKKYKEFCEVVEKYNGESGYIGEYTRVKESILEEIRSNAAYYRFNNEDMNKYSIPNYQISKSDIYKATNDGRTFISLDMIKGNFTSLYHYDNTIFNGCSTYEEYISMFTDCEYIKNSKNIRQVIFGNLNPKRQITYMSYLMNQVFNRVLNIVDVDKVVYFSRDEIVIDVTDFTVVEREDIKENIDTILYHFSLENIFVRSECFDLHYIPSVKAYVKRYNMGKKGIKFYCLSSLYAPFVHNKYGGKENCEMDYIFKYEGILSKLLQAPDVEVV